MTPIWHGRTCIEKFDAYTEFIKEVAVPDYQKTKGFINLTFLKRVENGGDHFTLITFWENLEVIKTLQEKISKGPSIIPKIRIFLWNLKKKSSITRFSLPDKSPAE